MKKFKIFLTLILSMLAATILILCVNCSATKEKIEYTEGVLYDVDASGEFAVVIGYAGTATEVKIAKTYNGVLLHKFAKTPFIMMMR